MPHDRFFSEESLRVHQTITLSGSELHHLQHVMRKKTNDLVEMINGRGELAKAKVRSIASKEALLDILDVATEQKPPPSLYLAQSWIHPTRLDWVLEKGCELGVTAFFLLSTDNSTAPHLNESKQERMRTLLISALKQCGRLDLPRISIQTNLSFLSSLSATLLFGDIRENAHLLKDYLSSHPLERPPCLLIGPEKGFSSNEIALLEEKMHATGVRLHSNILRSETAALMGLSLLAHQLA